MNRKASRPKNQYKTRARIRQTIALAIVAHCQAALHRRRRHLETRPDQASHLNHPSKRLELENIRLVRRQKQRKEIRNSTMMKTRTRTSAKKESIRQAVQHRSK